MTLAPQTPSPPPSGGLADYPLSEVEQVFKVVRIHGELEMVLSVPPLSHLTMISPTTLPHPYLPFKWLTSQQLLRPAAWVEPSCRLLRTRSSS